MAEKLKSINRVFRTGEDRRNRRDPHCSPSVSRRNSQPPSSLAELKKVIDNDVVPLPCRRLTLDQVTKDMEALILSRQDDPFLQTLASRESKSEDESTDDSASLIGKDKKRTVSPLPDGLSLVDIHEHMIRSPPPILIPTTSQWESFQFPSSTKLKTKNGH